MNPLVKYQTVIRLLDGSVLKGTVETAENGQASEAATSKLFEDGDRFYFESYDGKNSGVIRTDSVKAIYLGTGADGELHEGLRFFDSAPTPNFLWIRVAFPDGEVIEGMVDNEWSAFNESLIRLHLPSQQLGQRDILVPRTSISQFQVITTR